MLDSQGRGDLEEILVTARKREEKLQDVPISITAFTAEGMRKRNIQDAYDMANFTPNFSMTPNLGRRLDNPTIRGQFGPLIGGTAPNGSFFVDGVFVAGNIGSTSVANLERIEVLRGPQSATFGRATFSGAINFITRRPTNEFEGQTNLRAGEDGDVEIGLWGSGPIIRDKLYFFAGVSWDKWDGEWRNGLEPYDVVGGYNPNGYAETGIGVPWGQNSRFVGGGFNWSENPQVAGDPPCVVNEAGNSGFGCAVTAGDDTKLGGTDTKIATLKLAWDATDTLQFNFKYERVEAEDDHYVYLFVPPGTENNCYNRAGGPFSGLTPAAGDDLDPDHMTGTRSGGWLCGELTTNSRYVPKLNIPHMRRGVTVATPGSGGFVTGGPAPFLGMEETIDRYYVDFIWDLNDYELIARYARNDSTVEYVRDLDRSYSLGPALTGLFEAYSRDEELDDSIEVRLSSPGDKRVRWSVGYYWYDYEQDQFQRNFNGFSESYLPHGTGSETIVNTAYFGGIEADLADNWRLAFEGRYAKDEISRASPEETDPDAPLADQNFYSFSPRVTLSWNIKEDESLTGYAQIAEGNKPGGFNFAYFDGDTDWDRVNFEEDVVIVEEEATTYELGLKGAYFDGSLTANLSVFYIDWENQAINVSECIPQNEAGGFGCQTNNIVRNAGESSVRGLELETQWFPTAHQTYTLAYGYTDATLDDYVDEEFAVLQCPEGCYDTLPGVEELTPDARALVDELGNVNGNAAPRAPKHNLAVSQVYQAPLFTSQVEWYVRNDVIYESKTYTTASNLTWAPEQWTWNARLGLESAKWSVSLYVDNVTNEKSPTAIQDFPLFDLSQSYQGPTGAVVNQNAFQLLPRRTRNAGIVATVRFGAN
jgi:outer membrane receptor protein involved in Fe transport